MQDNYDDELNDRHTLMVLRLAKSGDDIMRDLDGIKMNLLHHAVGIAGEAGELLDAVKKVAVYNKPVDRDNIIEELGDLEFYMAGIREALAITRAQTLQHNMNKLAKRYGDKYSNEAAQKRADKE